MKRSNKSPPPSLPPEGNIDKKILEVTKKIIELLTGRGSYKVSGCHCLFLHGGVGVSRTQGPLQGHHGGEP
ncbi:unnamed protein product, partial [Staurois parvus]